MTEPAPQTEQRTCHYPGCDRPVAPADAVTGRPPEYCDDPEHSRASAWRARKREEAQPAGRKAIASEARPVDAARTRASEITGQVTGMVEHLTLQLGALLGELRTTGDPDAAEAQIESVTADAAERVAAAEARASRSDAERRRVRAEQEEADAAAGEAVAAADILANEISALRSDLAAASQSAAALTVELEQVKTDAATRHAQAQAEIAELGEELGRQQVVLAGTHRDLAATTGRATLAELAAQESELRATDASTRAELESERARRGESETAAVREQLEAARAKATTLADALGELRGHLAAATAERDAARADIERVERAGDRRVTDLREVLEARLTELKSELAETRASAARGAAVTDAPQG